jgi:hypothetical protein
MGPHTLTASVTGVTIPTSKFDAEMPACELSLGRRFLDRYLLHLTQDRRVWDIRHSN